MASIENVSALYQCAMLASSISQTAIATMTFGNSTMFQIFDLCCAMRVVVDPDTITVDSEMDGIVLSLQASKWVAFLSHASKDGLSLRLSIEGNDTILGRMADGTELRVTMDDNANDAASMDALFASCRERIAPFLI